MEKCVTLHTQRAVNIITRDTVYEELLVRKYKDICGVADIIGYAKRSGIEWAMDLDIAKEGFRYISCSRYNYPIGINMSGSTIQRIGIANRVMELASEFGVKPSEYVIEVSEHTAFTPIAVKNIETFKSNGVKIALDDFGAGKANIVQVADGLMDIVKIDRELIVGIGTKEKEGRYIALEGIYNICERIKCDTIVEGIETEAELSEVSRIGFKVVQGFLFDIPKVVEYDMSNMRAV